MNGREYYTQHGTTSMPSGRLKPGRRKEQVETAVSVFQSGYRTQHPACRRGPQDFRGREAQVPILVPLGHVGATEGLGSPGTKQ